LGETLLQEEGKSRKEITELLTCSFNLYELKISNNQLLSFLVELAQEQKSIEEIVIWLKKHTIKKVSKNATKKKKDKKGKRGRSRKRS